MGIIFRQGVKNSIVKYVSIGIGLIGTLFIYPLNWELYGTLQYWIAFATLLIPLLRFGSTALVNKFYPLFENKKISGFLGIVILITTVTISVMSISLIIIYKGSVLLGFNLFNGTNLELLITYFLAIIMIFNSILILQSSNGGRIVFPEIISNLFQKLVIITIVFASYLNLVDKFQAGFIFISYLIFVNILMIFYLKSLNLFSISNIKLKLISPKLRKDLFNFWLFGGLNYLGVILAYKLDLIMIGTILNKTLVGYYSTFLFMATAIEIPFKSILSISTPLVAKAFENNNIQYINTIYKKTSNNVLVLSVMIFSLIILNLDSLLKIMTNGNNLIPFKIIIIILGLSKIIDILTSINSQIIIYSKWFKTNLYFLLVLAISNIILNYLLINKYGVTGAAIATTFSLLIFNSTKLIYIYFKLKMHPFSFTNLIPLAILSLIIAASFHISWEVNPIIAISVKSIVFSVIYIVIIYFSQVSEDINIKIDDFYKKIKPY